MTIDQLRKKIADKLKLINDVLLSKVVPISVELVVNDPAYKTEAEKTVALQAILSFLNLSRQSREKVSSKDSLSVIFSEKDVRKLIINLQNVCVKQLPEEINNKTSKQGIDQKLIPLAEKLVKQITADSRDSIYKTNNAERIAALQAVLAILNTHINQQIVDKLSAVSTEKFPVAIVLLRVFAESVNLSVDLRKQVRGLMWAIFSLPNPNPENVRKHDADTVLTFVQLPFKQFPVAVTAAQKVISIMKLDDTVAMFNVREMMPVLELINACVLDDTIFPSADEKTAALAKIEKFLALPQTTVKNILAYPHLLSAGHNQSAVIGIEVTLQCSDALDPKVADTVSRLIEKIFTTNEFTNEGDRVKALTALRSFMRHPNSRYQAIILERARIHDQSINDVKDIDVKEIIDIIGDCSAILESFSNLFIKEFRTVLESIEKQLLITFPRDEMRQYVDFIREVADDKFLTVDDKNKLFSAVLDFVKQPKREVLTFDQRNSFAKEHLSETNKTAVIAWLFSNQRYDFAKYMTSPDREQEIFDVFAKHFKVGTFAPEAAPVSTVGVVRAPKRTIRERNKQKKSPPATPTSRSGDPLSSPENKKRSGGSSSSEDTDSTPSPSITPPRSSDETTRRRSGESSVPSTPVINQLSDTAASAAAAPPRHSGESFPSAVAPGTPMVVLTSLDRAKALVNSARGSLTNAVSSAFAKVTGSSQAPNTEPKNSKEALRMRDAVIERVENYILELMILVKTSNEKADIETTSEMLQNIKQKKPAESSNEETKMEFYKSYIAAVVTIEEEMKEKLLAEREKAYKQYSEVTNQRIELYKASFRIQKGKLVSGDREFLFSTGNEKNIERLVNEIQEFFNSYESFLESIHDEKNALAREAKKLQLEQSIEKVLIKINELGTAITQQSVEYKKITEATMLGVKEQFDQFQERYEKFKETYNAASDELKLEAFGKIMLELEQKALQLEAVLKTDIEKLNLYELKNFLSEVDKVHGLLTSFNKLPVLEQKIAERNELVEKTAGIKSTLDKHMRLVSTRLSKLTGSASGAATPPAAAPDDDSMWINSTLDTVQSKLVESIVGMTTAKLKDHFATLEALSGKLDGADRVVTHNAIKKARKAAPSVANFNALVKSVEKMQTDLSLVNNDQLKRVLAELQKDIFTRGEQFKVTLKNALDFNDKTSIDILHKSQQELEAMPEQFRQAQEKVAEQGKAVDSAREKKRLEVVNEIEKEKEQIKTALPNAAKDAGLIQTKYYEIAKIADNDVTNALKTKIENLKAPKDDITLENVVAILEFYKTFVDRFNTTKIKADQLHVVMVDLPKLNNLLASMKADVKLLIEEKLTTDGELARSVIVLIQQVADLKAKLDADVPEQEKPNAALVGEFNTLREAVEAKNKARNSQVEAAKIKIKAEIKQIQTQLPQFKSDVDTLLKQYTDLQVLAKPLALQSIDTTLAGFIAELQTLTGELTVKSNVDSSKMSLSELINNFSALQKMSATANRIKIELSKLKAAVTKAVEDRKKELIDEITKLKAELTAKKYEDELLALMKHVQAITVPKGQDNELDKLREQLKESYTFLQIKVPDIATSTIPELQKRLEALKNFENEFSSKILNSYKPIYLQYLFIPEVENRNGVKFDEATKKQIVEKLLPYGTAFINPLEKIKQLFAHEETMLNAVYTACLGMNDPQKFLENIIGQDSSDDEIFVKFQRRCLGYAQDFGKAYEAARDPGRKDNDDPSWSKMNSRKQGKALAAVLISIENESENTFNLGKAKFYKEYAICDIARYRVYKACHVYLQHLIPENYRDHVQAIRKALKLNTAEVARCEQIQRDAWKEYDKNKTDDNFKLFNKANADVAAAHKDAQAKVAAQKSLFEKLNLTGDRPQKFVFFVDAMMAAGGINSEGVATLAALTSPHEVMKELLTLFKEVGNGGHQLQGVIKNSWGKNIKGKSQYVREALKGIADAVGKINGDEDIPQLKFPALIAEVARGSWSIWAKRGLDVIVEEEQTAPGASSAARPQGPGGSSSTSSS